MEMLHGTIDVASGFDLQVFLGIPYAAPSPETSNCDGIQIILVKGLVPETPRRYFSFGGLGARGVQSDVSWVRLWRVRGSTDSVADMHYLRVVEAES